MAKLKEEFKSSVTKNYDKKFDLTFTDTTKIPEFLQIRIGKDKCGKSEIIRIGLDNEDLSILRNIGKIKIREVK